MDLDSLRAKLHGIDQQILELVAERQRVSTEIGRVKREAGEPPRDFGQEREVIERARAAADRLDLPGNLAEQLFLLLIESSLTVQEKGHVTARGAGGGKRVLVIGGAGKMGHWFVRFLESQSYVVEVADPVGPLRGRKHVVDWRQSELDHDLIVVAAPLRESNRILCELAQRTPGGLIFDIGSLKTPLRSGLKALVDAGARVTSLHPMFGPATELLSGCHVIFVDLGVPDALREAREIFASTMAIQVDMDLEGHDRLIAYVLGMSHALNIAFFTALADSGEAAPHLDRISSTSFDRQLQVAGRIADENPHLYFEIQALNEYGAEALASLQRALERLRSVVHAGDEEAFVNLMRRGREYLGGRRGEG
jgi:chorismate mutase/prephenate dehydrogenase